MGLSGITSTSGDEFSYSLSGAGTAKESKPARRPSELTEEERRQVQKLKELDAKVKAHESAHVAAGGQYVRGGASYEYQTGPDGRKYAVGGEVSIDTSAIAGDPQATITKMLTVKRAAQAPADPSGQDNAVAAQASAAMMKAQQELMKQQQAPGSASHGEKAKGEAVQQKHEYKWVPPFPKSSESAYRQHSGKHSSADVTASINVQA
jgi:hypothetical protein